MNQNKTSRTKSIIVSLVLLAAIPVLFTGFTWPADRPLTELFLINFSSFAGLFLLILIALSFLSSRRKKTVQDSEAKSRSASSLLSLNDVIIVGILSIMLSFSGGFGFIIGLGLFSIWLFVRIPIKAISSTLFDSHRNKKPHEHVYSSLFAVFLMAGAVFQFYAANNNFFTGSMLISYTVVALVTAIILKVWQSR